MAQARDEAGNIWETDDQGNPVRLVSAGSPSGAIPIGPRDTSKQQAEARAASADARANRAEGRAASAEARADAAAARAEAEWNATHNPDGSTFKPMPDSVAKRYEEAINAFANLDRAMGSFQDDFAGNPVTGGLENTIQKRFGSFGTPGQAQWWSDIQATDNVLRNALFGASLTAGEKPAWDQTTINPSMDPEQVVTNLQNRRDLAMGILRRRTNFLKVNGYDPEAVDALAGEYAADLAPQPGEKDRRDDPAAALNTQAPPISGAGPSAPTGPQGFDPSRVWNQDSAPPLKVAAGMIAGPEKRDEYDYGMAAQVDALLRAGAGDEQINALLAQRGYQPMNAMESAAVRAYLAKYPSYKDRLVNPPVKAVDQSALERFSQGIPGAALIGATNMGSFGGVQALAPEQYAMSQQSHPGANLTGSAVGAIAPTQGIGMLGRATAQRLAPRLLGGGSMARFGRNLAADAAYGATYGGVTEGDPVSGAGSAALGSTLGQGAGSLLGRLATGTSSATARALADAGIEMTPGQIARARAVDRGGSSFLAGVEDAAANTPGLGALVNARRTQALQQGNTALYREAGGGAPITGYGEDALAQLGNVKNAAYGRAVDGRTFDLADPQFVQQVQAARAKGLSVDAMRNRGDFGYTFDNELAPIMGGGPQISGRQWQDAQRLLAGQKVAYGKAASGPGADPAAAKVAEALGDVNDAFVGMAARQAPDAIPALKRANRINRNLSIMEDAAGRASKHEGLATPAQVIDAIKANNIRFGQGRGFSAITKSPLYDLANRMQQVLPNQVPPTGVNAAPVLTALGATAAGTGYATDSAPLTTLGALLLAAGPYTKRGNKIANAIALGERPKAVKSLGEIIRKRKGLFGSAAFPLLLEAQQ